MFYLSPTLTLLMLGLVPPVSIGAVGVFILRVCKGLVLILFVVLGHLWSVFKEIVKPNPRSHGRNDQGIFTSITLS